MSLIKQLWIAIILVAVFSLGGSLVVSTLAAKRYLEQQLTVKNLDNATSLALSLSQMDKDPVAVEMQIAAQFDAGHYRRILLTAPDGSEIAAREYSGMDADVPGWFMRLIPIVTHPGVAQVQDGWRQFGTLTLESHSHYAYETLWRGTLQMLLWFAVGGLLTGLIGTMVIKLITRPLDRVVAQAEAIGGRRFITTPEPATREFRSVVRAMNALSERVRSMMAEESARLEQLRRQTQLDPLTGVFNREQFLKRLDAALEREDASAGGVLLILRVGNLVDLNRRLGRGGADALLAELAQRLRRYTGDHADWTVGRLNGTDFALLAPACDHPQALATGLALELHNWLDSDGVHTLQALPVGACGYLAGEARGTVLARADGALAAAEQAGPRACEIATAAAPARLAQSEWRAALLQALAANGVRLGHYPVVAGSGALLHMEAPVRLRLDGEWRNAGYFMPWAARQQMTGAIDLAVLRSALAALAAGGEELGINLSPDTLGDAARRSELYSLLQQSPAQARRLWLELPAHGALRHAAEFRALCVALRPLGCRLGIDHVGAEFERIAELHDMGLDYVKVDASIVRGIEADPGNQAILRGLCTLAHSIGLSVLASGVASEAERATLPALGIDGMTGPAIVWPMS